MAQLAGETSRGNASVEESLALRRRNKPLKGKPQECYQPEKGWGGDEESKVAGKLGKLESGTVARELGAPWRKPGGFGLSVGASGVPVAAAKAVDSHHLMR